MLTAPNRPPPPQDYLMSNESNKILKQQAKERAWAEDEYYKKAWEAVLDKQEKERTDRWVGGLVVLRPPIAMLPPGSLVVVDRQTARQSSGLTRYSF